MELYDLGTALKAQLFESHDRFRDNPFFESRPGLLDRLVSKLTYCVRADPIRYVAVDLSQLELRETFTISAFTDDHVFHLVYDPAVDHITTSIVGRDDLQMLEVLSAPNFMRGRQPGTFEGSVKLVATFPTFQLSLPGDDDSSERNRAEVDAFLPALMRDLKR
ncbi:MAG: hypothetical protein M3116_00210 [Actinomycetota bacterium]|nr:hypothetical protein [Actinomycetota bacterium]